MRITGLILSVLCSLIFGCGRDSGQAPFEFGEVRIIRPGGPPIAPTPPPVVRVVEPAAGQRIKMGTTIDCRVELIVPESGTMPQGMMVELQRKGVNHDTCSALPDEDKGGGRYVLKGQLDSPKKPGRYTVRALANNSILIRSESDKQPTVSKPILTYSPPVEIEVE